MFSSCFHPSPEPLKTAPYLEGTGESYEPMAVDTRKCDWYVQALGERLVKCP